MSDWQKKVLAAAFDRDGEAWVWYANAWSRGVVVSAAERDIYLAYKPIAFRKAIAGRPATRPRRPYWPTLNRILTAALSRRRPAN
jgi:hypothetical protein